MKLSELIIHVGDDHVQLQRLDSSLVGGQVKKQDAELTFATDRQKGMALVGVGEQTHIGLIVWLPVERLPESMRPKKGVQP